MWVESHLELCQITNNQINHNLIKIIQLSLTIFDLWSHSLLWVVGWMDILTFFDIFLKPPQPLQGYFLGDGVVGDGGGGGGWEGVVGERAR